MGRKIKIYDESISYETNFRNVKYPRLEFKIGQLVLILPNDFQDDKSLLKKYKNWIYNKNSQILEMLKESKKKKLNLELSNKELKNMINDFVKQYSQELKLKPNNIYIKKMKTKWASCSSNKNLTINSLLKYLPQKLVSYIVFHELVHLRERRHNERFWNIISKKFKDYKKKEKDLFVYWFLVQKVISSPNH